MGDTTRRSSRAARSSQPLQAASHHSSASSNSSGRADRATRSHQKTDSPRKSTPTASLSSEPPDDAVTTHPEDTIQTRRKRARGDERDNKGLKIQSVEVEMSNGVEEDVEDDGTVRCLCGYDDYPGPPPLGDDDSKQSVRQGIEGPATAPTDAAEELSGFFLQCDVCKVWQHGGCVGIMNEEASPDEYFCEECRKDLHHVFTAPNEQRYSHYLPLYQSYSRASSRAASFSKDGTRSPRGGRASSSLQSAKRRSTMNSRDAAYDEEEQLRRAIEASKGEKSGESIDGGARRGKRGRSSSEEKPEGSKRQRTASASPSPSRDQRRLASQAAESDEGANSRNGGPKKIRGAAARNHREKELREERERSRLEAKRKREGRAERRRVDSEPPEEVRPVTESSAKKNTDVASQIVDPRPSQVVTPDTPPPTQPSSTHRKGGRPPNARKGRLGKNQYTKDRDLRQEPDDLSPGRSQSRDVTRNDENGAHSARGPLNEGKPSKSRGAGSKVTMSDMKKRVAAILDFISRTQVELASEPISPASGHVAEKLMVGIAEGLPMIKVNGNEGANIKGADPSNGSNVEKDFKDLSCLEMMDVLTRQLVKWQKEFI